MEKNILKSFDDQERVENAYNDLIRAIVWESFGIAIGEDEKVVDELVADCQEKLIDHTLTDLLHLCMKVYDKSIDAEYQTKNPKDAIRDCKLRILDEIRDIIPVGTLCKFSNPFFIHFIEGEVSTTENCTGIEIRNDDDHSIVVHYDGVTSLGSGIVGGNSLMCYDADSLADILSNLKKEIKEDCENSLKDEALRMLREMFKDWDMDDIETISDSLLNDVVQDVIETSDYPNYNTYDICIAIRRTLMQRVIR